MDRLGLTQKDLGKALGVGQSAAQKILARSNPELETLERLAPVLGFQPWELLMPQGAIASPEPAPMPSLGVALEATVTAWALIPRDQRQIAIEAISELGAAFEEETEEERSEQ